ncbi:MAG: FAD-binding protein [Lachnospiraceae bacterium]|nr:FAD-binding protein [Lachnospiraceae bacterium]
MPETERSVINIIGAGLAGLSAALELGKAGIPCRLISAQTSERAQSNLAEGGINACLDVMGEEDHVSEHFADTVRGGCDLADPNMVAGMCAAAPGIIRELSEYGVPFQRENGRMIQRNFGGQKKKRTAYVKSSTGKMITTTLIEAVRRYECEGLTGRFSHHLFQDIILSEGKCVGVSVYDPYRGKLLRLPGEVIIACGGINGFFSGKTTGTTANTGNAAALLFSRGVQMADLEMIQYHPTTVQIPGKRLLVSEAARGEGGRLFYRDNAGNPCYFMEEKYGASGNLMPRDVVAREMLMCGREVFLDLRALSAHIWEKRLSDLREELIHYLALDPKSEPVPVSPGIHFFMGGIRVNEEHRSNIPGLYAAGECACAYHGANRLGGNSLLGAIYGGKIAAESALKDSRSHAETVLPLSEDGVTDDGSGRVTDLSGLLFRSLPVLRTQEQMQEGLEAMLAEKAAAEKNGRLDRARLLLAEAILRSALVRKESRGAHSVREYPGRAEALQRITTAQYINGAVETGFEELPVLRDEWKTVLSEGFDGGGAI